MNESTKRQLQIGNSMNVPMLSLSVQLYIACKPGQLKGTSTLTVGLRWQSVKEVKNLQPAYHYSTQCPTLDYSILLCYFLLLTSFLSWILSLGAKIQVGMIPTSIAHKLLGESGVMESS